MFYIYYVSYYEVSLVNIIVNRIKKYEVKSLPLSLFDTII